MSAAVGELEQLRAEDAAVHAAILRKTNALRDRVTALEALVEDLEWTLEAHQERCAE